MKNQYFGDKRDLLKFSLLEALARGIPAVDHLTCIWLLTPPVPNNDGNRHFQSEDAASKLGAFLRECISNGRRDVRELAKYMAERPLTYVSFGDDPSQYFTNRSRVTYFATIPESALRGALVFFDPDNGLEPMATLSAAHLKYTELQSVFQRMDATSVAVVYQHRPRIPAAEFWPATATRVRSALDCPVGFVASGDVGFLIALRNAVSRAHVGAALDDFKSVWRFPLWVSVPG